MTPAPRNPPRFSSRHVSPRVRRRRPPERRRPASPSSNDLRARETSPPRADSRPSLSSRERPPVVLPRAPASLASSPASFHSCMSFIHRTHPTRWRRGGAGTRSGTRSVGRDASIGRGLDGPCPRGRVTTGEFQKKDATTETARGRSMDGSIDRWTRRLRSMDRSIESMDRSIESMDRSIDRVDGR